MLISFERIWVSTMSELDEEIAHSSLSRAFFRCTVQGASSAFPCSLCLYCHFMQLMTWATSADVAALYRSQADFPHLTVVPISLIFSAVSSIFPLLSVDHMRFVWSWNCYVCVICVRPLLALELPYISLHSVHVTCVTYYECCFFPKFNKLCSRILCIWVLCSHPMTARGLHGVTGYEGN